MQLNFPLKLYFFNLETQQLVFFNLFNIVESVKTGWNFYFQPAF